MAASVVRKHSKLAARSLRGSTLSSAAPARRSDVAAGWPRRIIAAAPEIVALASIDNRG